MPARKRVELSSESEVQPQATIKPKPKRMLLLRSFVLADFITLLNAVANNSSSMMSVALWLLPFALIFDILDGHVARWRQAHSPYGADLDSLSDVISFGIAPAVVGFTLGLRGIWDAVFLVFFVLCGVSRLARYNATHMSMAGSETGKVPYYEGFPIPTSLFIVLALTVLYYYGKVGVDGFFFGKLVYFGWTFHPFSVIYAIFGAAMVSSRLHIPKP